MRLCTTTTFSHKMNSTKRNSVVNKTMEISTEKLPKIHSPFRLDAPVTKLATKFRPFCLPRQEGPRPEVEENCQNIYAISFSSRLNHTTINNNVIVNNRHKKCKAVGTIADHRMTNNNRIHRQWRTFPVIFLFILFCFSAVNLSVASGHLGSQPIRKSHYSKPSLKGNNSVPFHPSPSPTLRSTTALTSFLPSDAIPPTSPGPVFRSSGWIPTSAAGIIRNVSISNVISVSSSGNNYNIINDTSSDKISNKNHTGIVINASASNEFSRRSSSAVRRRKNSFETVTSIDRPFYTKITSQDAVAKPGYYSRGGQQQDQNSLPAKKSKKNKANSSKSPKQSKRRKPVSSSSSSSSEGSEPVLDDGVAAVANKDENVFIPHTTEKAYRPPKLSLEPFFNFLTSLATASREVIMSKEQQNVPEENEHDLDSSGINGPGTKYSDSYDTINQSIRESAKKSKKSKKAKGEKKSKAKPNHHHFQKGSHGKRGGGNKRQKLKSEEVSVEEEGGGEEEEYGPHGQQTSSGPIPIPLPNPIIDTAEMEENENAASSEGLHILDVLRTPMIPDYESPILPSPPRAEPFIDFLTESNDKANVHPNNIKASTNTSSQFTSNPPSGRANVKSKGQGYAPFDKNENVGANANNKGNGAKQREKQRSESGSSISDQHNFSSNNNKNNGDLQAQESHASQVVVPSPYGMKHGVGGGSSSGGSLQSQHYQQHHFHRQEAKSNDPSALTANSFQPQHRMPPQVRSSEYAKSVGNDGSDHTSGQDDIVSKYPTTFVYKDDPSAQPGPGSTNSRSPFMSPLGVPPTANHPSSFRRTKLRPNLHSYYDPNYHHFAGAGEHGEQASEMIGIRHSYGPPHFRPPPQSPQNIFSGNNRHPPALPSPPRFGNGYGNRPGYMMMSPHPPRGTHYVGQSVSSAASSPGSSKERITTHRPFDYEQSGAGTNVDYEQDITGNNDNFNGNGDTSLMIGQDLTGGDTTGSASDIDHFGPDIGNSVISDSGETKKVGIMDSFDLFYREYKVLTWVAVFFVTSLSLLTVAVYLYINNPPTEVVQARKFPWMDQLKNPQLMKFLSSLLTDETNYFHYGRESPEQNFKPYGKGLGAKSGRQKRKQTRSQIDKDKMIRRINNLNRRNEGGIAPSRVI